MSFTKWHEDDRVNAALVRLLDELVSWERETGRGSTLILVPHYPDDGEIVKAQDGKPLPNRSISALDLLNIGLGNRKFVESKGERKK